MTIQSVLAFVLVVVLTAPLALAAPMQEPLNEWKAFAQKLEPGAFVEVRLEDGSKVKGNFIPSSDDVFRLIPKAKNSVPTRDLQYGDIKSIDRKHDGFWSPTKIGVTVAIAIGSLIAVSVIRSSIGG